MDASNKSQTLNTIADYSLSMVTSIQVTEELVNELKRMKMHEKETYEEIIWGLIEDRKEISAETKHGIVEAKKDIAAGRTVTLPELKKRLGM